MLAVVLAAGSVSPDTKNMCRHLLDLFTLGNPLRIFIMAGVVHFWLALLAFEHACTVGWAVGSWKNGM
jgi:hypothetical protein